MPPAALTAQLTLLIAAHWRRKSCLMSGPDGGAIANCLSSQPALHLPALSWHLNLTLMAVMMLRLALTLHRSGTNAECVQLLPQ